MQKIFLPDAPVPAGHYSPAVVSNGFVFLSGILPIHALTGQRFVDAPFAEQVSVVFFNTDRLLAAAGSSLNQVVRVTVYVADGELWGAFNEQFRAIFGDHKPARTVVPVSSLHFGALLEVDIIAEI
jgi:2-iminobutanoate/2-iminopropanoate deaminase